METQKPTSVPAKSVGAPRILIAEDEPALARAMARVLGKVGFEVAMAETGDAAVELLLRGSFDAILADINLPGMTGVDLLGVIRAYDLDVPVMLMTGAPTMDSAIEAVNLGAVQYLVKPVDNNKLIDVCKHAIGVRASVRADRERRRPAIVEDALARDTRALGASFDRALDGLWMAFQPIVNSNSIIAYEALMRSREPLLPTPMAVLEAAEKLGRLHELGPYCRDLAANAFEKHRPALFFS